jgi:hypothetical protein
MRRALAVLAVLAGSLVGMSGAAAPAQASTHRCNTPHLQRVEVISLTVHGLSCADAQSLAAHVVRFHTVKHYTCVLHVLTHALESRCHAQHEPTDRRFVVVYRPQSRA